MTLKNCLFEDNHNFLAIGGAMYANGCKHYLFDNVEFRKNSADGLAGAIQIDQSFNLTYKDCLFDNNEAKKNLAGHVQIL